MSMPVVEEDGGRLNAFAKEPSMQVINKGALQNNSSRIILIVGALLVVSLIALSVTIG